MFLEWTRKTYTFVPTAYGTDETRAVMTVPKGWMMGPNFTNVNVAFNGTGGRTFKFGTAATNGLFSDTADTDITAAAATLAEGVGAAGRYANVGSYLFLADTTINIYFTAATGGSPTVGSFTLYFWLARHTLD